MAQKDESKWRQNVRLWVLRARIAIRRAKYSWNSFWEMKTTAFIERILTHFLYPISIVLSIVLTNSKQIPFLNKWVTGHSPWVLVYTVFAVGIGIYGYYKTVLYRPIEPDQEELRALVGAYEHVVSRKSKRFGEKLRRLASDMVDKCKSVPTVSCARDVFMTITDPKQQFDVLILTLYQYFENTKKNSRSRISVNLAQMGDVHILDFLVTYPQDRAPKTRIEELRKPSSSFSRAKKNEAMVLVESTLAESKKTKGESNFLSTIKHSEEKDSSLICYPVIDSGAKNRVPYVICVYVNSGGFFCSKFRDKYEIILSTFATRILLEHRLLRIKEILSNEKGTLT